MWIAPIPSVLVGVVFVVVLGRNCCAGCYGWCLLLAGIHLLVKLYVFNLLYRNLTAAYLCCVGWLDMYGIMVSVKVSFL